ncbi:hypothetical protein D3C73_1065160 [compost metagenome]
MRSLALDGNGLRGQRHRVGDIGSDGRPRVVNLRRFSGVHCHRAARPDSAGRNRGGGQLLGSEGGPAAVEVSKRLTCHRGDRNGVVRRGQRTKGYVDLVAAGHRLVRVRSNVRRRDPHSLLARLCAGAGFDDERCGGGRTAVDLRRGCAGRRHHSPALRQDRGQDDVGLGFGSGVHERRRDRGFLILENLLAGCHANLSCNVLLALAAQWTGLL